MTDKRKAELEEKLLHLKLILDFQARTKDTIWKGREKEYQIHIDAILDAIIEAKEELKLSNNN